MRSSDDGIFSRGLPEEIRDGGQGTVDSLIGRPRLLLREGERTVNHALACANRWMGKTDITSTRW